MKARLTKGKRGLAAAGLCALALAACTQKNAAQQPPEPGDKAVARINGQPV